MHVYAHQRMYVHAFVLIIRLYWPLRWQRLFWIINTEQIKILFKSLPRKLAWRERRHAHSTTSVFSPQPCFLFTSVSTTPAHVSPHLLPQHLCAMVIHRSAGGKWLFSDRRRCPGVDTQELYEHCTFCAVLILCLLITNTLINGTNVPLCYDKHRVLWGGKPERREEEMSLEDMLDLKHLFRIVCIFMDKKHSWK